MANARSAVGRTVLRAQPDSRLTALAREGNEGAFDEIVRRYRTGLVAYACGFVPRDRAEDVVQEALTRTWRVLQGPEREIAVKPWLYAVVRNGALNARRDGRSHEQLDETINGVPQPHDIALEREELAAVIAAIGALPEAQRDALVRSAFAGQTHDQIAAAMGATPTSVRGLLHRARVGLRTSLGALAPLPLVRTLVEAGGVAAAAGAAGTGGSMLASKSVAAAVLAVVAAGAGTAVIESRGPRTDDAARAAGTRAEAPRSADADADRSGADPGPDPVHHETPSDGGSREPGGDDEVDRGDSSGPSANSGPSPNAGPGNASESGDDNSGPGSSSGSGSDDPKAGDDSSGSDDSGSGSDDSSGSGSSGSGSSGSGSDDDGDDD